MTSLRTKFVETSVVLFFLFFFEFVDNATGLQEIDYLDTGESQGLACEGNFSFITSRGPSGLVIVDISDKENVVQIDSVSLPQTGHIFDAGQPFGSGYIAVPDNHVVDGGLYIINVSNPYDSSIVGHVNKYEGSVMIGQEVFVLHDYAFLADMVSLKVVDITNRTNPTVISSLESVDPYEVVASGCYAYCRNYIVNVTDPYFTSLVHTNGDCTRYLGISNDGQIAFCKDGSLGFKIFDISDKTSPNEIHQQHDGDVESFQYLENDDERYVLTGGITMKLYNVSADFTTLDLVASEGTSMGFKVAVEESGSYVYATKWDSPPGLYIYEVEGNPLPSPLLPPVCPNWIETELPIKICYGVLSNYPHVVCSGNGDCIENDTCKCDDRFYGQTCNITECFGKYSNDSSSCGGEHGSCIDLDVCECFNELEYFGEQCVTTSCFGINTDEEVTCNNEEEIHTCETCGAFDYSLGSWGSEFLVNVGDVTGLQSLGGIADDPRGGVLVTYMKEETGDYISIQGQFYHSNGSTRDSIIHLSKDGGIDTPGWVSGEFGGADYYCPITYLPTKGFVMCYAESGRDGGGFGVFCQFLNNAGVRVGEDFQVSTSFSGDQQRPSLEVLSDGSFVVAWEGVDSSGTGIFLQQFESDGVKRGEEVLVNTYTSDDQFTKRNQNIITSFSDGSFLVVWTSKGQGDTEAFYGQKFWNNGSRRGVETRLDADTHSYQLDGGISNFGDLHYVVTYRTCFGDDVYYQLFDADGTKRGSSVIVNSYTASYEVNPRVTTSYLDGSFFITWYSYDHDAAGTYGVYGQFFDENGDFEGPEILINDYTPSNQFLNIVHPIRYSSKSEYAGFIVCWISKDQDGDDFGMYCKIFSSPPVLIGEEVDSTSGQCVSTICSGHGYCVAFEECHCEMNYSPRTKKVNYSGYSKKQICQIPDLKKDYFSKT